MPTNPSNQATIPTSDHQEDEKNDDTDVIEVVDRPATVSDVERTKVAVIDKLTRGRSKELLKLQDKRDILLDIFKDNGACLQPDYFQAHDDQIKEYLSGLGTVQSQPRSWAAGRTAHALYSFYEFLQDSDDVQNARGSSGRRKKKEPPFLVKFRGLIDAAVNLAASTAAKDTGGTPEARLVRYQNPSERLHQTYSFQDVGKFSINCPFCFSEQNHSPVLVKYEEEAYQAAMEDAERTYNTRMEAWNKAARSNRGTKPRKLFPKLYLFYAAQQRKHRRPRMLRVCCCCRSSSSRKFHCSTKRLPHLQLHLLCTLSC